MFQITVLKLPITIIFAEFNHFPNISLVYFSGIFLAYASLILSEQSK